LLRDVIIADRKLPALHVNARVVPTEATRALMSAATAIGIPASWTDSTKNAAVAVEATAMIDPKGGVALRAAAPAGAAIVFSDSVGLIDTVHARTSGGALTVGRVSGSVVASANGVHAQIAGPNAVTIRRILLIGAPGWESKFTMAALEERGWGVDARYALGKNVAVTQGDPETPDTSRYAAIVALDSTAVTQVAAIKRYVQSGGGLLLAGSAITLRELGDLLPGKAGAPQAGVPGALGTSNPEQAFSWRPITPDSNSLVIARSARAANRNNSATIVAERYGAGRVIEVAYSDVWEWRMAGPDGSVDAHRQWWGDLVAMVAYAPEAANSSEQAATIEVQDIPGNAAPYADMVARFGKSVPVPTLLQSNAAPGRFWEKFLMVLALVALLAEWASRRLRGAK
jgi:hypothetical protein